MVQGWGAYKPLLWNCQHFASFLAQIIIDTNESTKTIRNLLSLQGKKVDDAVRNRHIGFMAGLGLGLVPVVGPVLAVASWASAGIFLATDYQKNRDVASTMEKFSKKSEALQRLAWRGN